MTEASKLISLEEALRERSPDRERVDTVTLAGALREALPHLEADCDAALDLLAQAQAELARARAGGTRVELAEQTARLARTAVDIAARQVALRRGTLRALERELTETTEIEEDVHP